jgi:hypothetical protein
MEALDEDDDPVLFAEDMEERVFLPPESGEPSCDGDMQSSITTVWSSEKVSRSSSSLSSIDDRPPQRLNGVIMNSSKTSQ